MHLDTPNYQDMKHFHHLTKFPRFSSSVYYHLFPVMISLTRLVFPVLELYIKEIMWYKLLPVKLLLTLMLLRGIRVGGISSFLLLLNGITW